ncbi:H-NS histone family protein [Macromonas nakdongensis]|uniref:H-NS histone family protein n=1 Tax=Macromonas nakdongensis TaxID=1843082 RepID=UPI000C325938|nr:H-NS histone family protein [Macromonas nakdongensis]
MATYSELVSQAQALMQQAEQVRKQELANVIAGIKAQMREYGITVEDLGGNSGAGRKAAAPKSKAAAKYRGPNGELWSGGPGRKPDWVKAALAAGQDLDTFRI